MIKPQAIIKVYKDTHREIKINAVKLGITIPEYIAKIVSEAPST